MTVFIKRYPSNGELPQFKDGVYQGYFHTEFGLVKYSKYDGWKLARKYPDYFLEEIELPSEEDVNRFWCQKFKKGAMFMLNKLKTKSDGK